MQNVSFDLSLEELTQYLPEREEPPDFDSFWESSLSESRAYPLQVHFEPVDFGLKLLETCDVTFNGFGGQPVKAWLLLPRARTAPLSCLVEFSGDSHGRGNPTEWLLYSSSGYAHLVVDTREINPASCNPTGKPGAYPSSAPVNPILCGIHNPLLYYYRQLYIDGVRAVEAARAHPAVDPWRIGVAGIRQAGGVALAVAGLDHSITTVISEFPLLCHFPRAVELAKTPPYLELAKYLRAHRSNVHRVMQNLSYFDVVNFAVRSHGRALFYASLTDEISPPSTVFAAYNHFSGSRQLLLRPSNHSQAASSQQGVEKTRFLDTELLTSSIR